MIHRLFCHSFYSFIQIDSWISFSSQCNFFRFFLYKILYSNFWVETSFKGCAQTLTFISMVHILSTLHEREFTDWRRNVSLHQKRCKLLCIISLLQAVYTSSEYRYSFYAHCTHQITVCSVGCNKLELSGRYL